MAFKKEENDTVHCILFAFYAIPLYERMKTTRKTGLLLMNINKRHSTMLLAIRFNLREEQYSLISISNSRTTSSVANVFE